MEDALHTEVKKYYAIEEETEIAEYAKKLQNAYYIAEDEQGDKYYIGAKLYGHVFQALIPGQFLTYDGKYYEVQAITPQRGRGTKSSRSYHGSCLLQAVASYQDQ